MSQIEDLRKGHSNHEERLQKLESLITPFKSELEEGAKAKALEAQNFLDDAPDLPKKEEPVTGPTADLPADPQTPAPETNPEGGMGIVVGENGQQPSVSDEVKEEPKDEAN